MNIYHFNIFHFLLLLPIVTFIFLFFFSSLFFLFSLDLQFLFFNYFLIWCPISDPSNPIAHQQHRVYGSGSRQSDPSILPLYVPQNYVGLNKRELILLLTRLHLHRSSQAGDKVGFLTLLLLILQMFIIA